MDPKKSLKYKLYDVRPVIMVDNCFPEKTVSPQNYALLYISPWFDEQVIHFLTRSGISLMLCRNDSYV